MAQLENTRLVITDGLYNEALKQKIEKNVSDVLLAFNEAVIKGKNPSLNKAGVTSDGQKVITSLWKTTAMSCPVSKLERSCITRPNNSGYQIRNIPINMHDAPDDQFEQEIVINLTNDGRVDDIFVAVHQYGNILANNNKVEDLSHYQMVWEFVEKFRTSYNLRDIQLLETIFSDNALIISGKVIKQKPNSDHALQSLPYEKIIYQTKTKQEYLKDLKRVFKNQKYLNVVFEEVEVLQNEVHKEVYGVTLKQRWNSSTYKDVGYVFLMIDFRNEFQPEIHVRTWQPEKYNGRLLDRNEVFKIEDFSLSDF
jgi:hypothetical protein